MFPELQALPDDEGLMLRREYAQAKLDILRLAVNRFCEPAARAIDAHGDRVPACVADMSLVQRARPDVFRYRLRQALTLEVYRWQKQIEFGRFDEESFHECALLLKAIKEERLSAMMHRSSQPIGGQGMLMSLQERRPKLHRHLGFWLVSRVENERSNHVRKACYLPQWPTWHLPCAPKSLQFLRDGLPMLWGSTRRSNSDVPRRQGRHGGRSANPTTVGRRLAQSDAQRAKEASRKRIEILGYMPLLQTPAGGGFGDCRVCGHDGDGKRFFSAGPIRAKKEKCGAAPRAAVPLWSIMQGHTKDVTCLKIAHRQLFSTAEVL